MTDPGSLAGRWSVAVPYFPWRDLCEPRRCHEMESVLRLSSRRQSWQAQTVPDGVFVLGRIPNGQRGVHVSGARSLNCKGHVFGLEWALETAEYEDPRSVVNTPPKDLWINYDDTCRFALGLFSGAAAFFRQTNDSIPGYISLSLGLLNALNKRMVCESSGHKGQRFPDSEFRADLTVPSDAFLGNTQDAVQPLFDKLAFGFDLPLQKG